MPVYVAYRALRSNHAHASDLTRCRVKSDAALLTLHLGLPGGAAGAMDLTSTFTRTHLHTCMFAYTHTLLPSSVVSAIFPLRHRSNNANAMSTARWRTLFPTVGG